MNYFDEQVILNEIKYASLENKGKTVHSIKGY